jgi:hypothetical protein
LLADSTGKQPQPVLMLVLGQKASQLPGLLGCSTDRLRQLLLPACRVSQLLLLQQQLLWCSACRAWQLLWLLRAALARLLGSTRLTSRGHARLLLLLLLLLLTAGAQ